MEFRILPRLLLGTELLSMTLFVSQHHTFSTQGTAAASSTSFYFLLCLGVPLSPGLPLDSCKADPGPLPNSCPRLTHSILGPSEAPRTLCIPWGFHLSRTAQMSDILNCFGTPTPVPGYLTNISQFTFSSKLSKQVKNSAFTSQL